MLRTYRNVRYTVILLDGKRVSKTLSSPAGKLLTSEGVETLLANEAAVVEKFFPGREFRLVPLRNAKFNFVEMTTKTT